MCVSGAGQQCKVSPHGWAVCLQFSCWEEDGLDPKFGLLKAFCSSAQEEFQQH